MSRPIIVHDNRTKKQKELDAINAEIAVEEKRFLDILDKGLNRKRKANLLEDYDPAIKQLDRELYQCRVVEGLYVKRKTIRESL